MLKYILKIIKEERERIHSIMIEIIPEWIEKLEDEDLVFIKKFVLASGSLKEIAKELRYLSDNVLILTREREVLAANKSM